MWGKKNVIDLIPALECVVSVCELVCTKQTVENEVDCEHKHRAIT